MKPISPFIFTTDGHLRGAWAYMLTQSLQFRLPRAVPIPLEIHCGTVHISSVDKDVLTIHAGYAWDGCTCWPDSATNLLGSLPHDLGYQIGKHPQNPFTREEIDGWLLDLLRLKHDPTPRTVWLGVRAMGWKFWKMPENLRVEAVS